VSSDRILPKGESLRRAVRWLSEQEEKGLAAIEEACRRFNLSPKDEEFLIRNFRHGGESEDGSA
jgi:hypothetical protein